MEPVDKTTIRSSPTPAPPLAIFHLLQPTLFQDNLPSSLHKSQVQIANHTQCSAMAVLDFRPTAFMMRGRTKRNAKKFNEKIAVRPGYRRIVWWQAIDAFHHFFSFILLKGFQLRLFGLRFFGVCKHNGNRKEIYNYRS